MPKRQQIYGIILLFLLISPLEAKRSNNYAILMNSSKFWFNYRQTPNAYIFYDYMKKNGIPEENIIAMNPEPVFCGCRNNKPGTLSIEDGKYSPNLFKNAKNDYRLTDVSIANIQGYLRNRLDPRIPFIKRHNLNENSRVFIYINGHGGDYYWKIQDTEAILSVEIARYMDELYAKQEYGRLLFISDSCSAFTVFNDITVPNMYLIGSSKEDEFAFSHGRDPLLDTAKTDKFSYYSHYFLNTRGHEASIQDYFNHFNFDLLGGTPGLRSTFSKEKPKHTKVSEFFHGNNIENPSFKCFNDCTQKSFDSSDENKFNTLSLFNSSKTVAGGTYEFPKISYKKYYSKIMDNRLSKLDSSPIHSSIIRV